VTVTPNHPDGQKPRILAPAGEKSSFLAALQAGADAIYCGLKHFSARMEASNFTLEELTRLTALAHQKGVQVYVAMNSLIKPGELEEAFHTLQRLSDHTRPDAIIVQDLAFIGIAQRVGFKGEIHLSTLANVSSPSGLKIASQLGVKRVVIPRELSVDEMKQMASASPRGLDLEIFVQGALCYCVSGRCYWSSFFGGKSGLRGRCVQPCRRIYQQKGENKSYFSCKDLSLDVLTKVVMTIPEIQTLKIEGRKKGPHYVYYTVMAYRMLRDEGHDPAAKKSALAFLEQALGRPATHYNFLPQRPQAPVLPDGTTGSGLFLGLVKGSSQSPYLSPRERLMPNDRIRVGLEDEPGHFVQRISISVPKRGHIHLKGKSGMIGKQAFLIDRREPMLEELLVQAEADLERLPLYPLPESKKKRQLFVPAKKRRRIKEALIEGEMSLSRDGKNGSKEAMTGIWLPMDSKASLSARRAASVWWWLPPVVWPDDEAGFQASLKRVLDNGGARFVLNAPWQMAWFTEESQRHSNQLILWAGPFCNIMNGMAIEKLEEIGISGVIVSPELGHLDYLELARQSPLPLGIVIEGNWPLGISRSCSDEIHRDQTFKSPKGEEAFVSAIGPDYWVFPNWTVDLSSKKSLLWEAGYRLFIKIREAVPSHIHFKSRPGLWNWNHGLD
jgi:putative protease